MRGTGKKLLALLLTAGLILGMAPSAFAETPEGGNAAAEAVTAGTEALETDKEVYDTDETAGGESAADIGADEASDAANDIGKES